MFVFSILLAELFKLMDELWAYRLSNWLSFLFLLIVQKKPRKIKRFAFGTTAWLA